METQNDIIAIEEHLGFNEGFTVEITQHRSIGDGITIKKNFTSLDDVPKFITKVKKLIKQN